MKRRSSLFYPPQLNPPLVWLLQTIAPWLVRRRYRLDLVVSSNGLARLQALRQQRCLLLCNHPTFQDALAMFLLSAKVRQRFYYLAAYERFRSQLGWFYQQIGAYSIRRGMPDRESVTQTLALFNQPGSKLVVFPEGGCSFQNDTVMLFRTGAVQLAFQAMTRLVRQGQPVPDFYAVPFSLKYRYTGNMSPVINQLLNRLEQALGLSTRGSFYQRLRLVAEQVLIRCEQEYGVVPSDTANWNDRVAHLKAHALEFYEQQLGLTPAPGEPDRERVYRILNTLEAQQEQTTPSDAGGWGMMFRTMMRILNFDAIYDGYVSSRPTPERFIDTLIRMEREVFEVDQPPAKGHRLAFLYVGEPINLKDYFAAYSENRAATVKIVTQEIQKTVQRNLDDLLIDMHESVYLLSDEQGLSSR